MPQPLELGHAIQNKYGNAASASAVEHFFADVALKLKKQRL